MPGSRKALDVSDIRDALGFTPDRPLRWRGAYDPVVAYAAGDGVSFGAASFQAVTSVPAGTAPVIGQLGPEDSEFWHARGTGGQAVPGQQSAAASLGIY